MRKRSDPVLPDQGGRHMPADPSDPVSADREQLVRVEAYRVFEQRGREHGREVDDWLTAERKLTTMQR